MKAVRSARLSRHTFRVNTDMQRLSALALLDDLRRQAESTWFQQREVVVVPDKAFRDTRPFALAVWI
jgi:hypothetical protein